MADFVDRVAGAVLTSDSGNAATSVPGKVGGGVLLPWANQSRLTCSSGYNLPYGDAVRTVSLWTKNYEPGNLSAAVWFGASYPGERALFELGIQNGHFYFGHDAGQRTEGMRLVAADTWYLLTATYDGTQVQVYVNGLLDLTVDLTGNPLATAPETVGVGAHHEGAFGVYNQLAVWNRVLEAAEIAALYDNGNGRGIGADEPGLVACWNLDTPGLLGWAHAATAPAGTDLLDVSDPSYWTNGEVWRPGMGVQVDAPRVLTDVRTVPAVRLGEGTLDLGGFALYVPGGLDFDPNTSSEAAALLVGSGTVHGDVTCGPRTNGMGGWIGCLTLTLVGNLTIMENAPRPAVEVGGGYLEVGAVSMMYGWDTSDAPYITVAPEGEMRAASISVNGGQYPGIGGVLANGRLTVTGNVAAGGSNSAVRVDHGAAVVTVGSLSGGGAGSCVYLTTNAGGAAVVVQGDAVSEGQWGNPLIDLEYPLSGCTITIGGKLRVTGEGAHGVYLRTPDNTLTVNGLMEVIGWNCNAVWAQGGTVTANGGIQVTGECGGIDCSNGGETTQNLVIADGTGCYADPGGSSIYCGGGNHAITYTGEVSRMTFDGCNNLYAAGTWDVVGPLQGGNVGWLSASGLTLRLKHPGPMNLFGMNVVPAGGGGGVRGLGL